MLHDHDSLSHPVTGHMRRDFVSVRPQWSITECLESLRGPQDTGGIFYIYVTSDTEELLGVIPIRRMLSVEPDVLASQIMISRLITLPESATVFDACELFILHKFLAIPILNHQKHLIGIVDVNLFTDEIIDMSERREADDVFQWIGVKMAVLTSASPVQAFRYRFPWLTATMASGLCCAVLAGFFKQTLADAAILAMFLTVALGLGESVSIQSMTMTMQALQGQTSLGTFIKDRLRKEIITAGFLAVACGTIVGSSSLLWPGSAALSASIGISIAATIIFAGLTGLAVPTILHKLEHDPRVAAGPITLAIADLTTVFLYLTTATIALKMH